MFATLFCLAAATPLPFVPRPHCTGGKTPPSPGTGKGELLLTWVISVSHAEAKPEPMEMPVTLITWRRDREPGPQHCIPPSWVGR